jgi:hypothetical protein
MEQHDNQWGAQEMTTKRGTEEHETIGKQTSMTAVEKKSKQWGAHEHDNQ